MYITPCLLMAVYFLPDKGKTYTTGSGGLIHERRVCYMVIRLFQNSLEFQLPFPSFFSSSVHYSALPVSCIVSCIVYLINTVGFQLRWRVLSPSDGGLSTL